MRYVFIVTLLFSSFSMAGTQCRPNGFIQNVFQSRKVIEKCIEDELKNESIQAEKAASKLAIKKDEIKKILVSKKWINPDSNVSNCLYLKNESEKKECKLLLEKMSHLAEQIDILKGWNESFKLPYQLRKEDAPPMEKEEALNCPENMSEIKLISGMSLRMKKMYLDCLTK